MQMQTLPVKEPQLRALSSVASKCIQTDKQSHAGTMRTARSSAKCWRSCHATGLTTARKQMLTSREA
eukprot:278381-Chlamydomonas_euryale.AAC.7